MCRKQHSWCYNPTASFENPQAHTAIKLSSSTSASLQIWQTPFPRPGFIKWLTHNKDFVYKKKATTLAYQLQKDTAVPCRAATSSSVPPHVTSQSFNVCCGVLHTHTFSFNANRYTRTQQKHGHKPHPTRSFDNYDSASLKCYSTSAGGAEREHRFLCTSLVLCILPPALPVTGFAKAMQPCPHFLHPPQPAVRPYCYTAVYVSSK